MSAHDYFANYLATLSAAPNRMTYLGRSLGGAAAAWVAKTYKPKQLLLQSTFANLADTAANGFPLAGGCREAWSPVTPHTLLETTGQG